MENHSWRERERARGRSTAKIKRSFWFKVSPREREGDPREMDDAIPEHLHRRCESKKKNSTSKKKNEKKGHGKEDDDVVVVAATVVVVVVVVVVDKLGEESRICRTKGNIKI